MNQNNPSCNMSLDDEDALPKIQTPQNDNQYRIYLYNSKESIHTIHDIDLYKNLSGYISIFTNDIKDKDIICPEFVEERELKLIIEFILLRSKWETVIKSLKRYFFKSYFLV